jgi:hypothetical protein
MNSRLGFDAAEDIAKGAISEVLGLVWMQPRPPTNISFVRKSTNPPSSARSP